jgi:hypothetical protein
MSKHVLLGLAFSSTFLYIAGCSSSSSTATLSGKVTYRAQPLTGGTIWLHPREAAAGKYPPRYSGTIRLDGTFTVTGVPLGSMVVTIDTKSVNGLSGTSGMARAEGVNPIMKGKMMGKLAGGPVYVAIPAKYADAKTSGLSWETTGGKQSQDFDLRD